MSSTLKNLWGVVDMGSNGIRFSITDLSPATARILPAIYQDRAGISLYDAQWKGSQKVPIPDNVIKSVVQALQRFKRTCADFQVPANQVRIIATEATRVAINSTEYRAQIKAATGWEVEMLPKEIEGKTGALGVVSSFESVRGLMMDLGGGSTQITWITAAGGEMQTSSAGSVSMPYGAAALSRRLDEANEKGTKAVADLKAEIVKSLQDAIKTIAIPKDLTDEAQKNGGLDLYLSGGGFRGWGFVLMSQHSVKPYPIPIINGFQTTTKQFSNVDLVSTTAADEESIFRVSDRRANQVPAVALLVSCLHETLPTISRVHFAQGGVREGSLYPMLTKEQKMEHPVTTATQVFATASSAALTQLILKAVSPSGSNVIAPYIVQALAQSMYIHNTVNKDIQAAAGLRCTTTGVLAGMNGADHQARALLAIMLCERWGGVGSLSPGDADFYKRLTALVGPEFSWWAMYLGAIAGIVGEVYPAGVVHDSQNLLDLEVKEEGHKKHDALSLTVLGTSDMSSSESFAKAIKRVEKTGKKKNWPGDFGLKVEVESRSTA